MSISQADQSFYSKIRFLSSIPTPGSYDTRALTNDDLYEVCQYIEPYMIQTDKYNLVKRISQFRDSTTGDTCLHIAAKSSNKKLVQFLIVNNVVDPNSENNKKQNALIALLANNSDDKVETIGYFLAKYTNLSNRNHEGKLVYQISQSRMNSARARLLQNLRKSSTAKGI